MYTRSCSFFHRWPSWGNKILKSQLRADFVKEITFSLIWYMLWNFASNKVVRQVQSSPRLSHLHFLYYLLQPLGFSSYVEDDRQGLYSLSPVRCLSSPTSQFFVVHIHQGHYNGSNSLTRSVFIEPSRNIAGRSRRGPQAHARERQREWLLVTSDRLPGWTGEKKSYLGTKACMYHRQRKRGEKLAFWLSLLCHP